MMRYMLPVILLALTSLAWSTQALTEHEQLRRFLDQAINRVASFEDRFDAEVWLVDMSARLEAFVPDADARLRLLEDVHRFSGHSQLPPELVLAVIEVESRFDRFAVSRVGAQGLMQVMPFWKDEIGRSLPGVSAKTPIISCTLPPFLGSPYLL